MAVGVAVVVVLEAVDTQDKFPSDRTAGDKVELTGIPSSPRNRLYGLNAFATCLHLNGSEEMVAVRKEVRQVGIKRVCPQESELVWADESKTWPVESRRE